MTENQIPTEQELDALLDGQPPFDLNAVKRRTLARVGAAPERPGRSLRAPIRGLLIAAAICALSISAVTAADYATEGRISTALGIRREPVEQAAAPEPAAEPEPVQEPAAPVRPAEPEPEPEPEPVEPPELDEQIAAALQVDAAQSQRLRPAVQAVEQTAEDQDIRMTVLQTLGDPACLYVKLRFDFPEGSPLANIRQSEGQRLDRQFERIDLIFEDMHGYGYTWSVLESDETSVTYLLQISDASSRLNGQTVTISFENYGSPHLYTEDEVLHLAGEAGKPFTTIIRPDGSMLWDATEKDLAAVSAEVAAVPLSLPDGFTATRRADGNIVVSYDGLHGGQMTDVYWVPRFDTVIEGTWEVSWTLTYQDTSLYWEGETALAEPALTLNSLRLSPLSWAGDFTGRVPSEEEIDAFSRLNFYTGKYTGKWVTQLRHQDGSLTDICMDYNGGGYGKEQQDGEYAVTAMHCGGRFDQPIDLTDVTAVVIDGVEFPLS